MKVGGVGWNDMGGGPEPWRVRVCSLDGRVAGAGFLVCTGQVLTCAHVVSAAAGDPGRPLRVDLVGGAPEVASRRATVAPRGWVPVADDNSGDLAVLDLDGPPPPAAAPLHRRPL